MFITLITRRQAAVVGPDVTNRGRDERRGQANVVFALSYDWV